MKVTVNGKEKILKTGATLKDAVKNELYHAGALIAVHLSIDTISETTNDFEIVMEKGSMVLRLDDSPDGKLFRSQKDEIEKSNSRWVNRKLASFGSFKTDIKASSEGRFYNKYDCFFSLGGMDNHTTYMMIAKLDHRDSYGAGSGRIGRITVGRHLLEYIREGEDILEIRPVISEISSENVDITTDLSYKLKEGYSVSTNVLIELEPESPQAAEHLLIVTSDKVLEVTEPTGSYISNSKYLGFEFEPEKTEVREPGKVTVRNEGIGAGRIYIYKKKRQVAPTHITAGTVVRGLALLTMSNKGDKITAVTDPPRVLAIGKTQKEGEEYLKELGVEQVRKGDTSDDAVIVEQIPERTMEALNAGSVETFAVPRDKIYRVKVTAKDDITATYFRKVTGLSHKPIGMMKVQFTYEGAQMITFYGDDEAGKIIHPQELFTNIKRGDIGVTNQVRPMRGLMGIRLEDSKSYGPTGEEPYGTNLVGKFVGNLDKMLKESESEMPIYITEEEI
ncbi:MAG TPA: methanogenesis marker 3 protein [Candidatus Methanomethylophilaceae archaeon]|nr:methanogenesis marker 3 protein [Candidatus Methanomethylophilaceae archaeon]